MVKGEIMRIDEVKRIRQTMGMTQTEFGNAIGVSRTTVTDWENNKADISPAKRKKIIEFCKENKIRITR